MQDEEQHIRIKAILEILGKPKEYIEGKIKEYIEKIKEDENLMILEEKISEPKEQGKIWSIFSEMEVVVKGPANLVGFCIDYMPSSIEILKPEKFVFEDRVFTSFINDILAKLHKVDMIAKQLGTENTFIKKNMNSMIRNNLLILAKFGINNLANMSKATGIEEQEVKRFLDKLIEEKRIKQENDIYVLV